MARKALFGDKKREISNHIAVMLVRYLRMHAFKNVEPNQLAQRTGISDTTLNSPWWQDIPGIAQDASLDIGLVVKDQGGREVTLWPSENFGSGRKPPKSARKELPPVLETERTPLQAGFCRRQKPSGK